jgi:hypothetical protein
LEEGIKQLGLSILLIELDICETTYAGVTANTSQPCPFTSAANELEKAILKALVAA